MYVQRGQNTGLLIYFLALSVLSFRPPKTQGSDGLYQLIFFLFSISFSINPQPRQINTPIVQAKESTKKLKVAKSALKITYNSRTPEGGSCSLSFLFSFKRREKQ